MQITPTSIREMFVGFNTTFQKAYEQQETWAEKVATFAPSSGEEETYAWVAKIPRFREWVGDRVVNNLKAHAHTIVNKDWEDTISLDRNKVKDDKFGLFAKQDVTALAQAAKMWPQDVLSELIEDGTTSLCYDGQFFFDTDHPIDLYGSVSGTQSNNFTSKALTLDNYYSVRASMRQFKGEDNKPLGIVPDLLVVPPALEKTGKEILEADLIANSAGTAAPSNVGTGTARLLVIDELTSSTTWYLLATGRAIKPFVFQMREAPQFDSLTSRTDPNVFNQKKFIYGADARGNAGYGLWFLAARGIA